MARVLPVWLVWLTLLALPTLAAAAQAQPPAHGQHTSPRDPGAATQDSLTQQVQGFLYQHALPFGDDVQIEVFPPAAHFPACEGAEVFLPRPDARPLGRVSVGVRCGLDGRRVRYLQAEVTVYGTHLVAARDIEPGERISADMLVRERVDLGRLPPQSLTDLQAAIGQQAKRRMRQGQSLSAYHLETPRLVQRGQAVSVEAQGNGFRIRRQGEALDEGGAGDTVRVRFANRDVQEARVAGPGLLSVTF